MAPENQYTMSAAATIAPIVLWSDHCSGNLYLARKNTFLEFYTDENKALKRSAYPRSASADSHFKSSDRSTTATPTNRSGSPSNRSWSEHSSDEANQSPECFSPTSTESTTCSRHESTRWSNWDADCDAVVPLGYPASMSTWPMAKQK